MKKLRRLWLILLIALLCVSTTVAFHAPPWDTGHHSFSGDPGDSDNDPGDDGPCKAGSPVEVVTGNFSYSTRDLSIPGLGPDIDFARTYNSNDMRRGPLGTGWVYPYDQRLTETTDGAQLFAICTQPNGKRERFVKQSDGSYLSPAHIRATLVKGSDNTHTLRDKNGSSRRFNTEGKLISVTDRNGNKMTFAYDETGFPKTITDASGRVVQITKGADGRIASILDPASRVFRYTYNTAGNLVRFVDPLGNSTNYQYDSKNNLTAILDPRGNRIVRVTYDAQNRVATLIEAEETWTYTYQPTLKRTRKQDSSLNVWMYEYNSFGNITKRTDPLGSTEVFEFDANANVTAFTNKNSKKTTATYDSLGNVKSSTDALGNTTSYTYDPTFDVPLTSRDALGNVRRFEYDSRGNLVKSIDPFGKETTFQYDSKGQLIRETDALGNSTRNEYDAFGNLTLTVDASENSVASTYDILGRLITMTDREGRTGKFVFDENDRLVRAVDAENNTTTNEYDAAGNLVAVILPNGARTTYAYDSLNRQIRVTNSLGQVTTTAYDRKNNLVLRTDPRGVQIRFTYDVLSRVIKRTKLGDEVSYTYDRSGNLLSLTDSDSSLVMVYDALNRITEVRTGATSSQPAATIRYAFDANGNRKSLTGPDGGITTYTYDALLRLTELKDPSGQTFSFNYDTASKRTRLTRSSGLATTYTYDEVSKPVKVTHQSAAGDRSFTTGYDRVGNRLSVNEPTGTHVFVYDGLYRLVNSSHPPGGAPSETYSYDRVGNRTVSHISASYTYNSANRLTADALNEYSYDANGNLTRKANRASGSSTTYSYDADNQLISITFPNGKTTAYSYDGIGRRIAKNVDGQITRYVYDGMDILNEYSSAGTLTASYVNGPELDEVLAVRRGGTNFNLELDPLGSVSRVTNGATTSASFTYDSFGRIISQTGPLLTPFGFQGREFDPESGLYYFRARYYDPEVGRFINEDPIRFSGGINFYQFARNNPATFLDPMGMDVGFWESMIPIWGSGRQAADDFKCGRWGWGLFNSALAVSDVFLVKSLVTGIAKGAFKIGGSSSWKATRTWLQQTGRVEYTGQHFHHWLFERNQNIGKFVPDAIKNQPWNLMGLPGVDQASSNAFHQWLHHQANPAERLWYGTPAWSKALGASGGGRAGNAARGKEKCECP